jgi:hypothetical protein
MPNTCLKPRANCGAGGSLKNRLQYPVAGGDTANVPEFQLLHY